MPFSQAGTATVDNLYARLGEAAPNFCYAGHTDVVPVGDPTGWTVDPFAAEVIDGVLYGRGASDMKAGIAAFVAATTRFLNAHGRDFGGSISLLITGDEEGVGINGIRKMVPWLTEHGETLTDCLVGEPTNPKKLGEMMKIGRRGSLVGYLTVHGTQGHTAYPHLADNPIDRLIAMLSALRDTPLDQGTEHFQPSSFAISTIDVGNPATNVIPAAAKATFNIRFNDRHTQASLGKLIRETFDAIGGEYEFRQQDNGEAFLCEPGRLAQAIAAAAKDVTGVNRRHVHHRRHVGCALYSQAVPLRRVRPGGRDHAQGRRAPARRRHRGAGRHLPRRAGALFHAGLRPRPYPGKGETP